MRSEDEQVNRHGGPSLRDARMFACIQWQDVDEPIDKCGAVAIHEKRYAEGAFLRMAVLERKRARARELPAQRLVLALGRWIVLVVQCFQRLVDFLSRRVDGAGQRGVDADDGFLER